MLSFLLFMHQWYRFHAERVKNGGGKGGGAFRFATRKRKSVENRVSEFVRVNFDDSWGQISRVNFMCDIRVTNLIQFRVYFTLSNYQFQTIPHSNDNSRIKRDVKLMIEFKKKIFFNWFSIDDWI